ncbi:allophanate hydrolase [Parvibaculum sp.]|uniref:allophanate hydrolase n=1 Tax=Parvibaculum sp. TaxID=2024848 RepID=UPI000C94C59C|nr:allophanate hydrolase [Parvibaculum sp.]MAB14011.1 allophanate hydrolase [Parvibaculum sp.]
MPFTIADLRKRYAEGLTPAEVVETVFERLAKADDPGIFIHLADKQALLDEAAALGTPDPDKPPLDKPLWGVPFAVKDNIDVAGMPTTAACKEFEYTPSQDAETVARLKAAGGLCIGKTNLDQFATGLVGVRTPYPVPKNAVDPSLVPGGSSSGSAVAVARGIVSFALGTDTAGSGRVPAGLNNIVGLKPTVGAMSTSGVVPACRTLDCVSVFALTVEDSYEAFQVMAAFDESDPYSRHFATASLGATPPVLKVGVPAKADRKFFGDTDMEAAYEAALDTLASQGHQIVEIPFGDFYAVADLLYEGAWVAERYAAIEDFIAAHESALHPVTAEIILGARKLGAVDAFKGLYALQAAKRKLAPVIGGVDLFCVPTAPTHYTVDEVLADPIGTNSRNGTYTNFVNLLDMCGFAVPTGTRGDGLPASVTLLARAGRDWLTAAVARDLHAASGVTLGATGWSLPETQPAKIVGAPGEIELVVVGAHLSGMPLNRELTELDAVFDRAVSTTPDYRLYALPTTPVAKPGLIRDEKNGVAIAAEVWRLTPEGFGRFVSNIPSPLGIGTLTLADGTSAKGFICETFAVEGAEDVSGFGGWRAYIASKTKTG